MFTQDKQIHKTNNGMSRYSELKSSVLRGLIWETAFMLFLFIATSGSAYASALSSYNLQKKFTFSMNDVPLKKVIRHIENNSEYVFLYTENIDDSRRVSVTAEDNTLAEVLDKLLSGSGISYEVRDRQILLKPGEKAQESAAAAAVLSPAGAKGAVRNENGEALVGAAVYVKGTDKGVYTDIDGHFEVGDIRKGDILVFAYMSASKELAYGGESWLDVVLEEGTYWLENAVVVGYGQMRKQDITGSLTTVKIDDKARGFIPAAQDMLVGKVAGVSVINSGGAPNGHSYIRIRGGSSLSANNEPLIIVDGVFVDSQEINGMGNVLSSINPSDIETFTVLKDASATAIYGSRASNGVILITTKRGSEGRFRVTYDGNISVGTLRKKLDVLTGDEFRTFLKETYSDLPIYGKMAARTGLVNTDWQSEIFQTTVNTEHNLSFLGSVRKVMPYRVSIGYSKQDGILKTSSSNRYTGSLSLSPSLFDDHLKMNFNGLFVYAQNRFADWNAIGAAMAMDPSQAVYDRESPYGGFFAWTGEDNKLIQVATKNPVSMLEMLSDKAGAFNFKGSAEVDYRIHFFPDLRLNVSMSMDASNSNGRKYYDPFSPSDYMYGGYDSNWTQSIRNTSISATAKYDGKFSFLDSHLDVMLGYEWQHYWRQGHTHGVRPEVFDKFGDPLLVEDHGYENEHYIVSFFGRLNYSMMDRYLMTVTLRQDGSSRFARQNRWSLFPAVALAWRISEEDFLKWSPVVSDLKLRLGWGVTGQQEINIDYGHMRTYLHSTGSEANYLRGFHDGEPVWVGLLRPESYNPDLKWESTITRNIGLDFGFVNNRIEGSLDIYSRTTKDLINLQTKTTAGTNFKEFVATNIGSLQNSGFEFSVNADAISTKDFNWQIGLNFAYNHNRITKLSAGDDRNTRLQEGVTVNMVGQAANMYYVYEQVYDSDGKPVEGLYVDRNSDGKINADDLRPYKKAAPDWTMGLNTKLTWKSWDLSIAGHGSFGTWNYNAMAAGNAGLSPTSVYVSETLVNRPRSAFETNFQIAQPLSDYYVQNASFFRIDNIVIGWSFGKSRLFPLAGRIFATVQNPFVFTSYKGVDPEVFGGYDGTLYPRPLTVLFGVNLNF